MAKKSLAKTIEKELGKVRGVSIKDVHSIPVHTNLISDHTVIDIKLSSNKRTLENIGKEIEKNPKIPHWYYRTLNTSKSRGYSLLYRETAGEATVPIPSKNTNREITIYDRVEVIARDLIRL
jgi:hypothetical protein